MRTKDGKKIILLCECGRLKVFQEWVFPTKEAKEQIKKERQMRFIKFVKSVCDSCVEAKNAN